MKKTAFIILLFLLTFKDSFTQDPHFSQFFASPLTLNPALTGKFYGTFRAAGNYRNQWPSINNAFTTGTVSLDFGILRSRIPDIDQFGIGIMGLYDQNGNGILKNNFISISTAYHKGLDEDGYHQLGIGFQGTYAQKRLDITKADFEDELTALGFTGVTQEVFNNENLNIHYFDVNAGIIYNGATSDYNNFYLGASVYHVNRPKESFQGANFILNPRFTVHGGGYFPVATNILLHASAIYQTQAGTSETVAGAALGFDINQDENNPAYFYAGTWYRFNDAFIPYLGLEFGDYRIGVSYDVNTSSLKTASNLKGGIEISLIYIKHPVDKSLRKLNCPKF